MRFRSSVLLAGLAVLLAACSSTAVESQDGSDGGSVQVDVVGVPDVSPTDGVLTQERIHLTGSAAWESISVADLMRRRAVTPAEREAAERTIASGPYLGDAVPVVRLTSPGVTQGLSDSGTAYLLDAFPGGAAPGAFRTALTFEYDGPDGSDTSLALELRDPAADPTGGVGQLLVTFGFTALSPDVTRDSVRLHVLTRAPGGRYESVQEHRMAPRDWRGAHRLVLDYDPGRLAITLDGVPLMSAPVRLSRPAGPIYVGSYSGTPTLGVALLDWTFSDGL